MRESPVSRRSFLTATTASVAIAVLDPKLASAARRPEPGVATLPDVPVKLGVASYSLRRFPREKALEMVKALRTPYVNFKSVHAPYETPLPDLMAIRKQVEAAGFQIVGGGTIDFTKDADDDVRGYFEYARAAGMPLIVGTCAPPVLPRVEKFAKAYGIKVAIHNHGPEDKHFPSPYDVLKAVKNMDPRMGLCMDIGHTARTGTDIVKAARDAGPRLLDIHAKDLRDSTAKDSQCIVGEGVLPIPELFKTLAAIEYGGYVNLEYEIDETDPLPGMKQSFAFMRGVLAAQTRTRTAGD
jgi:sugar phosphate isomerase/epimerase